VECLYRAGFALSDIDMMIVTHDHVDHASSLEPLLALRHEMAEVRKREQQLVVLGNRSVVNRWSSIATYAGDTLLSFVCLDKTDDVAALSEEISRLVGDLSSDAKAKIGIRLTPLPSKLSSEGHFDLAGNPSFGVLIAVREGNNERTIAMSGDLPKIPEQIDWPQDWRDALKADVLVCHLSTVPLAELRQLARLQTPTGNPVAKDIDWINNAWRGDAALAARLTYAYWLKGAGGGPEIGPVGDDERLMGWEVPRGHPYLAGTLRIAQEFMKHESPSRDQRLFVIGELSEELGSFRSRIAWQMNRHIFKDTACRALTSDIGLEVLLTLAPRGPMTGRLLDTVSVLCSFCDLDNDLAPVERYHSPDSILEICVKGENEGIFYNCPKHDPVRRPRDPIFLEKLERYDVYGR
jgi:hypothetical protein